MGRRPAGGGLQTGASDATLPHTSFATALAARFSSAYGGAVDVVALAVASVPSLSGSVSVLFALVGLGRRLAVSSEPPPQRLRAT